MRLAVMSDVHANLPALEAVLEDLRRHSVDGIIVAGDLVCGPQPVEAARLLRSLGGWMIRGNGDTDLLQYHAGEAPEEWYTRSQFALMRWMHGQADEETLEFIGALPEERVVEVTGTAPIRVVHGSPGGPSQGIFPRRDSATLEGAWVRTEEPVLVCGHTHTPWVVERGGRLALNPGAVCSPLDGTVGAQYALLTWKGGRWQVAHKVVRYDLDAVRAIFRDSGLLEECGGCGRAFLLSLETGRNVFGQFLSFARELCVGAGFEDCDVVPDDIWERAKEEFDWDGGTARLVGRKRGAPGC